MGVLQHHGRLSLQGPFVGWAGGVGGVAHGLFLKSKNSLMSIPAASRLFRFGKPKRASIIFNTAMVSVTVCET